MFLALFATHAYSQGFDAAHPLQPLPSTKDTGEKPQSKVWKYDGTWWSVFPDDIDTYIWRLDGKSWSRAFKLSSSTVVKADCKPVDDVCHILLWKKAEDPSQLISVEYVPASKTYKRWSQRSSTTFVALDPGVETGTIDIDATGRMWLASDGVDDIRVRWSDPPYSSFSGPIVLASGVQDDDIGAVISLPVQRQIGVFWSNQNTKRFGFKTHNNGTNPALWSADEVPASQSALNVAKSMSDDHLNLKVSSNGTLYCAIKTGYDGVGPLVSLLKRRPNGIWDDLYEVSRTGTRPIVILNEVAGKLKVVYSAQEGGSDILYKESPFPDISFGPAQTILRGALDDATSAKDNYDSDIVILASDKTKVAGIWGIDIPGKPVNHKPVNRLVGYWSFDEGNGTTIHDASGFENNGQSIASPVWTNGISGSALTFNGSSQYTRVQDSPSLDISEGVTLAAWIRPEKTSPKTKRGSPAENINIISKGSFTLSLTPKEHERAKSKAAAGANRRVLFTINQNSTSSHTVESKMEYPDNGTWTHIAGTFNGRVLKIYINGKLDEQNRLKFRTPLQVNDLPLLFGAAADGTKFYRGALDELRVYNYALSDAEIRKLLIVTTPKSTASARGAHLESNQIKDQENADGSIHAEVQVFPNPAEATLSIHLPQGPEHTISITDRHGNILYSTTAARDNTKLAIQLDELDLRKGMYFITIQSSGSRIIKKFFKN